jgi:hypothetical protein
VGGKPAFAFYYNYQANLSTIAEYDASGANFSRGVCFRHDPLGRMTLFGWQNPNVIGGQDSQVLAPVARFKYQSLFARARDR